MSDLCTGRSPLDNTNIIQLIVSHCHLCFFFEKKIVSIVDLNNSKTCCDVEVAKMCIKKLKNLKISVFNSYTDF